MFSIIIPTFNNLNYLKITCKSIKKNSRLNNEIIKQRLSCIPIHELYKRPIAELNNLLLEGLNAGEMIANGMIAETLDPKSIFVKILTVVKSKNFSPEEETKCIRDLNIDLKKAHEKKMNQHKK